MPSHNPIAFFLIVVVLTLLQGCDSLVSDSIQETEPTSLVPNEKLRHGHLLDRATQSEIAGKTASSKLNLIFSIHSQRILDRYKILDRFKILDRYKILDRFEYQDVFNGFAISVEDLSGQNDYSEFIEQLKADPDVMWIEPDFGVSTPIGESMSSNSGQMMPWNVAAIGGQSSWTRSGDGTGKVNVDVYILDTGVSQPGNGGDLLIHSSQDFRDATQSAPGDLDGHGTHIAGTIGAIDDSDGIVGVAPGVRIHNYKVLNDDGKTDVSVVIAAVENILQQKLSNPSVPVVVNLSLGEDIGNESYTALDQAIQAAHEAGVVFVAAAGNQGKNAKNITPAHVTEIITVGSYNKNAQFSSFSNYGSLVDIMAPGEDILSLAPDGSITSMNGTSMATAHVTGAAALYLAKNPNATPEEVQASILENAKSIVHDVPGNTTTKAVWVGAPEDVIAHWTFNEAAGTVAAENIRGANGSLINGPTWQPGLLEGALSFDGNNDRVDLGSIDFSGNAMSIAFYFKADDFGTHDARFISKASSTNRNDHYWMVSTYKDNKLRFRLKTSGSTSELLSSAWVISPNTWHAIVAHYDGTRMRLYVDGNEVGSKSKTGMIDTNADILGAIGNQPENAGNRPFDGFIDDMKVYDRALTLEEIQELASVVPAPILPSSQSYYWPFNETGGTVAAEVISQSNGNLVNGPIWQPGIKNGALAFDGSNDRVDLGAIDLVGDEMSIAFWFKADDFGTDDARFISKATSTNRDHHYWMVSTYNNNRLRFRLKTNGLTTELFSESMVISPNTWYAVVAHYDGSYMRLFVDGQEVGSMPKTGMINFNSDVLAAIGNQPPDAGSRPFDGLIDEMRIYDRALTLQEIQDLANF
ncbi:MAG: S8 family serine peptidase [Rhodothermaceae bacterium]|nr:S8 family serine peptidase [Rhodothermaceae bacterium]